MNKFSSEYGSIMIESSLDSEHFINRLVNRNASLAEKVVYKIEQMKEALRSRTDERARAERKRLIKAENLYLKAARAAGNHRLENYILSRLSEEDEKEVDSEAERIKYSYAGEKAKNADRLKLSTAEQMLESGVDAETVRKETGWFKGYDGKWRFEIDDSELEVAFNGKFSRNPKIKRYAELVEKVYFLDTATQQEQEELSLLDKKIGNKSIVPDKLGDLIKHPTLFEAYPELADIDIYFNETEKTASYHPGFKEISIPKSLKRDIENFKRTLIHEIQHAIQDIEGFAGGSNPDMFNDTEKQSAFEQYRNTAGEIEARDVANRVNMTAEQRKNTRPDIDRTDAVIIESEYAESVDTTDKGVPVVVVNDDITRYAHNDKTLVKLVKASIGKMPYVALGRQKIKFLKDTKREVTYSKYTQWLRRNMPNVYKDKMRLFGHPSEIIIATTNYVNEAPKHPRNDDIVDFARGEVLIDISGRKYKAEVIIGFTNKGECELHDVENLTPTTFKYKKRDALSTISHSGEHLQKRSSLGNSISDSEQKINPSDENFSENFSNDGKIGEIEAKKGEIEIPYSRKRAPVESRLYKEIAENENLRVYEKKDAERIINSLLSETLVFNEYESASLNDKTKIEAARILMNNLNKATSDEKRRAGAEETATYIIAHSICENWLDDYVLEQRQADAFEIWNGLKQFLHNIKMSDSLKAEIKRRFGDKASGVMLAWYGKNGADLNEKDLNDRLSEYGFTIKSENEADIKI